MDSIGRLKLVGRPERINRVRAAFLLEVFSKFLGTITETEQARPEWPHTNDGLVCAAAKLRLADWSMQLGDGLAAGCHLAADCLDKRSIIP